MIGAWGFLLPLAFFVVWLALIVYLISLATRLVHAVERIADRIDDMGAGGPAGLLGGPIRPDSG